MNKILKSLFFFLALFALNAFGQNYKSDIDALRQQQKSMYESSDFKLISKKIPLIPKDATLEQLADTSKPTNEEKFELAKFQQFRSRIDERGNQISMIYMKPETYATALVAIRRDAIRQYTYYTIIVWEVNLRMEKINPLRITPRDICLLIRFLEPL